MKMAIFGALVLACAAPVMVACGTSPSEPAQQAPDGLPGISVTDGRLVLPAVKGNPAAVYFNITYSGDDIALIRAVDVQHAKSAVMHNTQKDVHGVNFMQELLQVKLEKGQEMKFAPGGDHVMAMGLDDSVKVGDTVEVTLTFLGGDKYTFPATVKAPGDGDAMDMGGKN